MEKGVECREVGVGDGRKRGEKIEVNKGVCCRYSREEGRKKGKKNLQSTVW